MSIISISDLLAVDRIIPKLRAKDKRQVLRELANHAARELAFPKDVIVETVLSGAECPVFGPGAGVALPHILVAGLDKPLAVFARLDPAVDLGATDGSRTDLVALLLSPQRAADVHLRALACLARRLRQEDVREHLRAAPGAESMYVVLVGDEGLPRQPAVSTGTRASTTKEERADAARVRRRRG